MIESIVFYSVLALGVFAYIAYLMYPSPDPELLSRPALPSEYLKCESPIERKLYNTLTLNGYSVISQHKVGKYRGDLFIPPKLIIECDGKAYHTNKARDKRRDKYIEAQGYKVIRFSGSRIHRDIKGVVQRIDKELTKLNSK
jgi:very-short-patch-repair endonuclease